MNPVYSHKYKQIIKPHISWWVFCYSSCSSGMVTDTITVTDEDYIINRRFEADEFAVPKYLGLTFAESFLATSE